MSRATLITLCTVLCVSTTLLPAAQMPGCISGPEVYACSPIFLTNPSPTPAVPASFGAFTSSSAPAGLTGSGDTLGTLLTLFSAPATVTMGQMQPTPAYVTATTQTLNQINTLFNSNLAFFKDTVFADLPASSTDFSQQGARATWANSLFNQMINAINTKLITQLDLSKVPDLATYKTAAHAFNDVFTNPAKLGRCLQNVPQLVENPEAIGGGFGILNNTNAQLSISTAQPIDVLAATYTALASWIQQAITPTAITNALAGAPTTPQLSSTMIVLNPNAVYLGFFQTALSSSIPAFNEQISSLPTKQNSPQSVAAYNTAVAALNQALKTVTWAVAMPSVQPINN